MIDDLYNGLGRFAQDDTNGHLRRWNEATCFDLEWIDTNLGEGENGEPPWSKIFDLTQCPAECLPYLAQYVGTKITPSMNETQARQAIADPVGFSAGLVASIRAGVERTLTGTKRVVIRTRTPDVTSIYIRTLASETPDPEETRRLLRKELVPWHLVLEYEAVTGISYIDLAAMFEDYDALEAADLTYDELSELTP